MGLLGLLILLARQRQENRYSTVLPVATVSKREGFNREGQGFGRQNPQKAHWQIERHKNRHAVGVSGGHYRNEPRLRAASGTEGLPRQYRHLWRMLGVTTTKHLNLNQTRQRPRHTEAAQGGPNESRPLGGKGRV